MTQPRARRRLGQVTPDPDEENGLMSSAPEAPKKGASVRRNFWWHKFGLVVFTLARIAANVGFVIAPAPGCFGWMFVSQQLAFYLEHEPHDGGRMIKIGRVTGYMQSKYVWKPNHSCMTGSWLDRLYGSPFDDDMHIDDRQVLALVAMILADMIAKPIISAIGFACFLSSRFKENSPLHVWSRRLGLLFVVSVGQDLGLCLFSNCISAPRILLDLLGQYPVLFVAHVIQMHLTNLKLGALGYRKTARTFSMLLLVVCAECVYMLGLVSTLICRSRSLNERYESLHLGDAVKPVMKATFITMGGVVCLQVLALLTAACSARTRAGDDQSLRSTVWFLFLTSFALLLEFFVSWHFTFWILRGNHHLMTVDLLFQVVIMVALSGIVSPSQQPVQSFESLKKVGFAISGAKSRLRVRGFTNNDSLHCIASFPGSYSEEWDEVVDRTGKDRQACSLACVFLTDKESGLGQHAEKPHLPGSCWCHTIYGTMPWEAYLSVVESDSADLNFEKADAEAMGKVFLEKPPAYEEDDLNEDWLQRKADAERRAKERCHENQGKAPWGCLWLEKWITNIEIAEKLKQKLHVFYFKGKKGEGKLPWAKLNNENEVALARKNTGLGRSQTVEVAYLDMKGLKYEEHDIAEFKSFMEAN